MIKNWCVRAAHGNIKNILTESYGYLAGKGTCTTTPLVQDFAVLKKGTSTKVAGWKYTYNAVGNITRAVDALTGDYRAYSYDDQGQLQFATDYASGGTASKRYKYSYDAAGNLTLWKVQNGAATVDLESHTYTYGNSEWKDLVTAFDGHTISYDTSGNPLSYYNGKQYTMSWRNGRELDTLTVGGKKSSYQYDVNGLRTKKTNPDGSDRCKSLGRKKTKPKPSEAGSVWRGTETERTKISARRCGNLRQRSPL